MIFFIILNLSRVKIIDRFRHHEMEIVLIFFDLKNHTNIVFSIKFRLIGIKSLE